MTKEPKKILSIENDEITPESIDQVKEKKDIFGELIEKIINYLKIYNSEENDIKERLSVERELKKYQEKNTPNWLLNLILCVYDKQ